MTRDEMLSVLADVHCDDYRFHIGDKDGTLFLQGEYSEPDTYSGDPGIQKTRKWILSEHMTKSEFVQTCFKLIMTSYEHRARESFMYRGRRVFGPHIDVDKLWQDCGDTDAR